MMSAHEVSFTAPGDDWYSGAVDHYLVTHDGGSVDIPAVAGAGGAEVLAIPAAVDTGSVQAVDDAGNLGRALPSTSRTEPSAGCSPCCQASVDARPLACATPASLARERRDVRSTKRQRRPTVAGVTLRVLNLATGESAVLAMPASAWSERRGAFRYKDGAHVLGRSSKRC
jgi:hypothetical protein